MGARLIRVVALAVAGVAVALGCWHAAHAQRLAPAEDVAVGFAGRLLALSDADQIAGAYADGVLNKVAGVEDSLAVVEVVDGEPRLRGRVAASNSVVSWPDVLARHPRLPLAYVAETRGRYAGAAAPSTTCGPTCPRAPR